MFLSPKYMLNMDTGGHTPTYLERKPRGWSRFYHSDYLLAFPIDIKAYGIWDNIKISLGLWDGVKSTPNPPTTVTVPWDTVKTQIQSAHLVISAQVIQYAWPGGSCGLTVLMNGVKVAEKSWVTADVSPYSERVDILSYLRNGPNDFEAKFDKLPVLIGDRVLNINATLELTYGGEEPPDPSGWEQLVNWTKLHPLEAAGVAGIGMVAVAGVIYLRKRR